ncbi:MAG: aspartyl/asparaginyl beta-hydroxylase domain-containing protein [Brevundimonas sp.]|uniref:aspartyl/asparaginyl beta-hydroxylase domain-containing protein n=1 Tax=Brevundimonas sp. TaxID=1871086 RepID=UPI00271C884B|nr:aspartyl/asparaginyl beta-hydroxylase domain-containing protein [Brevundimonas sp.]MDO9075878.1 aspartyl/asparaginyl beta-hydroxylase domain-containing protein [Brevundimonas sp.]
MNQSGASAQDDLLRRAAEALARRDPQSALGRIDQADAMGATHDGTLNRALALRLLGDFHGALAVLDDALAMQPYDFAALLGKASMLEQVGQGRSAADVYRNALKIAPPRERCPPVIQNQIDHAAGVVRRQAEALRDHMRSQVAALRGAVDAATLDRFDEGLEIYAGLKTAPKQEPLLLDYPRLPPIPFYDRAMFPWLETLEAATPVIKAELEALLAGGMEDFAPYIAYPKGAPVNQWGELNHSRKWSSLWLWKDGARQDAVCERCPRTAALLESLPMCRQDGFAPTAVFSALQPRTHIPAHTGSSNVRLLTHLPLILPGPARFRVGNTVRDWKMGEAWVFDDTIDHEAWNDADAMRVILIFDIWNPYLSEAEQSLITAMMQARRSFGG